MAHKSAAESPPITIGDLSQLPPAIDLPTASSALGISKNFGYELAQRGEFPCRVLRLGNRYRVLTADLRRVLGVGVDKEPPPT